MIVVIEDGLVFGVIVVEVSRSFRAQQKILVDESHRAVASRYVDATI
jgi:hypothetical protein